MKILTLLVIFASVALGYSSTIVTNGIDVTAAGTAAVNGHYSPVGAYYVSSAGYSNVLSGPFWQIQKSGVNYYYSSSLVGSYSWLSGASPKAVVTLSIQTNYNFRITSIQLTTNQVKLNFDDCTNAPLSVYYSLNLSNWQRLFSTNTGQSGQLAFPKIDSFLSVTNIEAPGVYPVYAPSMDPTATNTQTGWRTNLYGTTNITIGTGSVFFRLRQGPVPLPFSCYVSFGLGLILTRAIGKALL